MDGYQRSYSSLNWPPMLIKQKYLTLIVIIIIIIRGNTDDTADLDTHTIRYEMLFSTCALKPT